MALKINKNLLTLGLMGSSILLLMLLQAFWIIREYQGARQTFRKETNLVFQNALHDFMASNFQEMIHIDSAGYFTLPNDSGYFREKFIPPPHYGIHRGSFLPGEIPDTLPVRRRVRMFLWNNNPGDGVIGARDTVQAVRGPGRFIIRFHPDSLDTGRLSEKLGIQVREISPDLKFKVIKKRNEGHRSIAAKDTAKFVTEFVRISPRYQYAASFEGVNRMLLKEIIPQISFSAFLLLLTTGAFFILYKNLRRQQNLVRQKNDFISNISHELKTPVATVSVALEALKNFKALENPKRTDAYLDLAQHELKRLSVMTDKILDITVLEKKGRGFATGQLDLRRLMLQVIDSMLPVWKKQNATVDTHVSGNDFILAGNRVHLSNALHNLLDNAVKYSGAPARLAVILKEESHQVMLTVQDRGIGIPIAYQKKIFEKFFRVPRENVHNVKGHGLGLSYTLQVVKAHHGRIAVESEPGKGSSFSIIIDFHGINLP